MRQQEFILLEQIKQLYVTVMCIGPEVFSTSESRHFAQTRLFSLAQLLQSQSDNEDIEA